MDIIGTISKAVGGDLLRFKVILATVVFALAGVQVILAARFFRKTTFPPVEPKSAARAHRWVGRVTLLLTVFIGMTCLLGPAGATSPTRVLLHSIFGTLLFALLAVKFTILRVAKKGGRYLPLVGSLLFLTFGAIWATSVADYVAR